MRSRLLRPIFLLFVHLFSLILEGIEVMIFAAEGEKFAVRALFNDLSVGENDDLVRMLNGGKSVGNHEHGADIHHFFQGILNEDFRFGVDVRCRFIEDHNGGLMRHGSRKGEKLTLTCGEVVAALTNLLVKTVFELINEVVGVNVTANLHNFFVCNGFITENDVASDGTREKENVLKHLTEMTAQGRNLNLIDVDTINEDLSLLNIVVSADEGKDGGLARACGADKRHGILGVYVEGNVLQHPFARNVGEPYVFEFDLTAAFTKLDGILLIDDDGLDIENGKYLFSGSEGGLQAVELLRKALNRIKEFGNIHIERDENVCVDMLAEEGNVINITLAAEPEETEHGGIEDQIHHGTENTENEDLVSFGLAKGNIAFFKITHLFILAVEDLNDLHARKVFGKERIDIRCSVLDPTEGAACKFAENEGEENDEGNEAKHHQRQRIVENEHGDENAEDDEKVFDEVHKNVGEHHGNRSGVVCDTSHKLTNRHFVKLGMGKLLDMSEGILADGRDDLLSRFLKDDRLQIHGDEGNEEDGRVKTDTKENVLHFKFIDNQLFDACDHERGDEIVGNGEKHQKADEEEIADIGTGITKKTSCDLAILHVAVKADGLLFILHGDEGDEKGGGKEAEDAADDEKGIVIRHVLRLLPQAFGG